jgi:hypothetical protein
VSSGRVRTGIAATVVVVVVVLAVLRLAEEQDEGVETSVDRAR